jgi:pyruvate dehydrogenase E2 component (dihydrolipoamide acetyltransferase)
VGDHLAEGAPVAMIDTAAPTMEQGAVAAVSAEPVAQAQSRTAQAASAVVIPSEVPPVVPPAVPPALPTTPATAGPAPVSVTEPAAVAPSVPAHGADTMESVAVYAGPAVRKLAREFGVQLGQVEGSGPQGRILKEDLQQFVQGMIVARVKTSRTKSPGAEQAEVFTLPLVPEIDFAKFGEIEITPRSKLDTLTAANMQRSWLNVPHVTQFDEADITDLEEFRAGLKAQAERRDTRLTPLPFLLKACAVALRDNPRLNSSLARGGENLIYKKYIHIGMAVDTPAGLMVPVLRDVDRKTVWELAREVAELAAKARERKLSPADMQGGCFTISSLGNIGGSGFTPIVNTPEVGILGVSKAAIKPVWNGAEFMPRTLLPLALSYDHRVVNGGDGGRFLTQLVALLSDIRQLSL